MAIPIPLLIAGMDLIKSISSNDHKENEEKVVEVLSKVVDERPFWKTKTFWSVAIGFIVPIVNKITGLGLDVTELTATLTPLLLFIATEQWKKK